MVNYILKTGILVLLVINLNASYSQNQTPVSLAMKNGRIDYEDNFEFYSDFNKPENNIKLKQRLSPFFKNRLNHFVHKQDSLSIEYVTKINTKTSSNYFFIRCNLNIIYNAGKEGLIEAIDFYEKPVKKGISNQYSKLEYRWWDFRQNKPWTTEDEDMFNELNNRIRSLIDSIKTTIYKIDNGSGKKRNISDSKSFKILAFYSNIVEQDHIDFSKNAIDFYKNNSIRYNYIFDTTNDWEKIRQTDLQSYKLIIWLNDFPHTEEQRKSFENFMENGGAWLGFHVSGYNDKDTKWPWFVNFLGGAIFYNNNWPPLPAWLIVDDNKHPVTARLPKKYLAPINEWYGWQPNPRLNKNVKVLLTLDPLNYPLGKKDIIRQGDIPVVWTNKKYKMIYMNMGHGDQIFKSSIQNKLFVDAILWLAH